MPAERMCKRYAAFLAPYSEDALCARDAARVKAHVETCSRCLQELVTLRKVGDLLRAYKPPVPEPSLNLWRRIHAEIAPTLPPAPSRRPWWRGALALPVAGLAAAALVLGAFVRPWMGAGTGQRARHAASAPAPRGMPEGAPGKAAPARALATAARRDEPLEPARTADAGPPTSGMSKPKVLIRPKRFAARSKPVNGMSVSTRVAHADEAYAYAAPPPASAYAIPLPRKREKVVERDLGFQRASGDRDQNLAEKDDGNAQNRDLPELAAAPFGSTDVPGEYAAAIKDKPTPVSSELQPAAAPVQKVSAMASAVDAALDVQRQRELFRYSQR